jgi:hypothetical protein
MIKPSLLVPAPWLMFAESDVWAWLLGRDVDRLITVAAGRRDPRLLVVFLLMSLSLL